MAGLDVCDGSDAEERGGGPQGVALRGVDGAADLVMEDGGAMVRVEGEAGAELARGPEEVFVEEGEGEDDVDEERGLGI